MGSSPSKCDVLPCVRLYLLQGLLPGTVLFPIPSSSNPFLPMSSLLGPLRAGCTARLTLPWGPSPCEGEGRSASSGGSRDFWSCGFQKNTHSRQEATHSPSPPCMHTCMHRKQTDLNLQMPAESPYGPPSLVPDRTEGRQDGDRTGSSAWGVRAGVHWQLQ